jgi:WD40 repeat protein
MKRTPALVAAFAFCAACCLPPAHAQPAAEVPPSPRQAKAAKRDAVKNFTTPAAVATVACSPDGKLIAVANGGPKLILQTDGTGRLKDNWKPTADVLDAATGKTVVSLKLATADEDAVLAATPHVSHLEVTALAFSPDGNVLAVGTSVGQVKLFDARTGRLLRALDDDKSKRADKQTPANWQALPRAMGRVASLAFSPDGSLLATCGDSFADFSRVFDSVSRLGERVTGPGRLEVWDAKTGALKHDLVGHSHAQAVAFSPDGTLLASAGRWLSPGAAAGEGARTDGAGVILWNVQTAAPIRTIPTGANAGTRFVAFSPDGKQLVANSLHYARGAAQAAAPDTRPDGLLVLADVATGAERWRRTIPRLAAAVAILPNDSSVIALCDGALRFVDTDDGKTQQIISPGNADGTGDRWTTLATAKHGHMQVMAGTGRDGKGTVYVLDPDDPHAGPPQPNEGL